MFLSGVALVIELVLVAWASRADLAWCSVTMQLLHCKKEFETVPSIHSFIHLLKVFFFWNYFSACSQVQMYSQCSQMARRWQCFRIFPVTPWTGSPRPGISAPTRPSGTKPKTRRASRQFGHDDVQPVSMSLVSLAMERCRSVGICKDHTSEGTHSFSGRPATLQSRL